MHGLCKNINLWRTIKHHFLSTSRKSPLGNFLICRRCKSYLGKWEQPSGQDTGISVYNSAVNKIVPLILQRKNVATWYMCGPTVYAESHVGHASCYVKFDIIRRVMENAFNINVICILGITDIDDKIINQANKSGVNAAELAKKYELHFFEDMESLSVLPPSAVVRVTENIPVIIEFCSQLIEKDYAYATSEGDVYFTVSKGVTADLVSEIPASEVSSSKRDPRDFALWKSAKPQQPSWESPWGPGRPGWHIECSAMASKMFGSLIDMHSGGYDLLFPHHANEISQSEAYHDCSQWVNYWLHAGLLQIGDEPKMSKSLNNTISIQEFLKDHAVNDFRILCLQSLYRNNMIYNEALLSQAKSLHTKLHNFINDCELYICGDIRGPIRNPTNLLAKLDATREQVMSSFRNDFNTSQALLHLTNLVDETNKSFPVIDSSAPEDISTVFACYAYVKKTLESLGISILSKNNIAKNLVHYINTAVELRNNIRKIAVSPNSIGGEKLSQYVDCAYQNYLQTAKVEFPLIMDKLTHTDIAKMVPKSPHLTEDSFCLFKIKQDCKKFYDELITFANSFDSEIGVESFKLVPSNVAKKSLNLIFTICDSFRLDLSNSGIGIKDRGANSLWIPSIKLNKILHINKNFRH